MNRTSSAPKVFAAVLACLAWGEACRSAQPTSGPARADGEGKGLVTRFEYGEDGSLTARVDPDGRRTRIEYKDGRPTRIEYADGKTVNYSYDPFGRRRSMNDWTGVTRYEYDSLSRLTRIDQSNGLWGTFEYDGIGRLSAIVTPADKPEAREGWRVEYEYDFLGRLAKVKTPAGDFAWSYDPARGTVTRRMPNGVTSAFVYDGEGRIERIRHGGKDDTLLVEFAYAYLPCGRLAVETETRPDGQRVTRYGYDKVGRLVKAEMPDGRVLAYAYDDFDNRLSRTQTDRGGKATKAECTYDGRDQILRSGPSAFRHDSMGNVAERIDPGRKVAYSYDAAGRLIGVRAEDVTLAYTYNGDGSLVGRSLGKGKSLFLSVPSGAESMILVQCEGNLPTRHLVRTDRALGAFAGKSVELYLEDRLRSVRAVAGEDGTVVRRIDYEPFGDPTGTAPGLVAAAFAGLPYDAASGLVLTKLRACQPGLGIFLQPEPMRLSPRSPDVMQPRFAYCQDDPVNLVDRNGDRPEWADIVDVNAAKQWYADAAQRALDSATPRTFLWAVAKSTFCDLIGGFIPGEHKSVGQLRASLLWTLASSLTGVGEVSVALNGMGIGRTAFSSVMNSATDHPVMAGLDIVGLGGSSLGLNAERLATSTFREPSGQEVFALLVDRHLERVVKAQEIASQGITALGIGQELFGYATWKDPERSQPSGGAAARPDLSDHQTFAAPSLTGLDGGGTGGLLTPTQVGGVYLGGAGKAMADLGEICGVTADKSTGRITLLSRQPGKDVTLPKLDLGDFAVALRSVYLQGRAPDFSLDPDPRDPEGPRMLSRFFSGTEDTRTGWILFEADRLMKCYTMNLDNVSGKSIGSRVSGYEEMLVEPLRGEKVSQGATWHRYWLEPLAVPLRKSSGDLVMLDRPKIEVKVQKMELKGGKLVEAGWIDNDPSAEPFKKWFTRHYDEVAAEGATRLPDPIHKGETVNVFGEVRNLAALAGVAEQLKAKGVQPPSWLMGYPSQMWKTSPTTPATRAEISLNADGANRVRRIYGGVDLAPKFVEGKPLPPAVEESVRAAANERALPVAEPKVITFTIDGEKLSGVVLPGDHAVAPGAFRQSAVDLMVPIDGSHGLEVRRDYSSFSDEAGRLGRGWRLAMPRLELNMAEFDRRGDTFTTKAVSARLNDAELGVVEEFAPNPAEKTGRVTDLVSQGNSRPGRIIYTDSATRRMGDAKAHVYHLTHGENDYMDFLQDGTPLTKHADGVHIEYEARGPEEGPYEVTGMTAMTPSGKVSVSYELDKQGRLLSAKSSSGEQVSYLYDDRNLLTSVRGARKSLAYQYDKDGRLIAVGQDGKSVAQVAYNDRGQITGVTGEDGRRLGLQYQQSDSGQLTIVASDARGSSKVTYDQAMRVLSVSDNAGNQVTYSRDAGGAVTRATFAGRTGAKAELSIEKDSATVSLNGRRFLSVARGSGGATRVAQEGVDRTIEYDSGGRVRSETFTPTGSTADRITITYDGRGRMTGISDGSTELFAARLDPGGAPEQIKTARADFSIQRDPETRLPKSIRGSDGRRWDLSYDPATRTALTGVTLTRGDAVRRVSLEGGLPVVVEDFDGGTSRATYENGLLKATSDAIGRKRAYEFDRTGHLLRIRQGLRSTEWMWDGDRLMEAVEYSLPIDQSLIPQQDGLLLAATRN